MYKEFENVDQAWTFWFDHLVSMGDLNDSRDGAVVGEVINAISVIDDPTRNIVKDSRRNMPMRYALGELLWYLSGSDRLSDIRTFSKAWNNLSDDGEHINSAYGHRIFEKFGFNQWEHVKTLLKNDSLSRQAVIHIKEPNDQKTKDLPCTVALQFFIRDFEWSDTPLLSCTCYMRSNDIWLGFPYDVFTFTSLQMKMAMELGVGIGSYTHIAGSLHLYERNVPKDENSMEEVGKALARTASLMEGIEDDTKR